MSVIMRPERRVPDLGPFFRALRGSSNAGSRESDDLNLDQLREAIQSFLKANPEGVDTEILVRGVLGGLVGPGYTAKVFSVLESMTRQSLVEFKDSGRRVVLSEQGRRLVS